MAYFTQDMKKDLSPKIKALCKKYKVSASTAVDNHSTFVLNIKSSPIDFITNYNETRKRETPWASEPEKDYLRVNEYYIEQNFSGDALTFLTQVRSLMSLGNWDNSRHEVDHFDIGWYTQINIGKWNKPFVVA